MFGKSVACFKKPVQTFFYLLHKNKLLSFAGESGSGKTSAMIKLVLDWAEEDNTSNQSQDNLQAERLKNRFDFVFFVPLKHVDSDVTLEQVIIQEHDLGNQNLTHDEIKTTIDSPRSLLIFDGYDEYKKGTNSAIDATVSGERGKSFVLITSRPDYMSRRDKKKLDGEIQNNGLSNGSIKQCTQQYLKNEEKANKFLKKAEGHRVYKLLRVPILLLMMCLFYIQKETLPRNRGKFARDIIDMYIMKARERGVDLEDTDRILLILGELSYKASQRDTHQLLIRKVSTKILCCKCNRLLNTQYKFKLSSYQLTVGARVL